MCGLAGLVNLREGLPPPSRELLGRMAAAMRHRGPDEFGYYRDARAGLSHARLSIVDLSSGQQPLANEDGSTWVAFNGEIFNHVELRAQLEAAGHVFRTRSDTEVIVHAWEQWREEAFARFNGQWAIALWDARARELVLCRDRLGVRPLFYAEHEGRLYFASEVKSIFADEGFPRRVDPEGLDETFTFWGVLPPRTLFRGVCEIEAGHWLRARAGEGISAPRRYWSPTYAGRVSGAANAGAEVERAAGELREKLAEATRLRIVRADVPVGSYLSGGLDSSLIAALGRRAVAGEFKTFSLRFTDAEYDETEFQREMVKRLETEHSEVVVSREDIARVFPEVVYHAERPILRTAPAPMFLLSRLVRERGIKVVLTGEGADEMFAGYDLFREDKLRRFWARAPGSALRPRLFEKLYPYLSRSPAHARGMALKFWGRGLERVDEPTFSHAPRWDSASALKRLFSPALRDALGPADPVARLVARLPAEFASWPELGRAQYLECATLLTAYLLCSQGDRMLMANSVEGRFPFLDRDVVEYANALPPSFKLRVLDEKHVLKRAARGLVPEAILHRKKQPYRAPDALAFVGDGRVPEYVQDLFSPESLREAGLFDPGAAHALYQKCVARGREPDGAGQFSNADNMAFVGVLSAQLLHRQLVKSPVIPTGNVEFATRIDRVGGAAP